MGYRAIAAAAAAVCAGVFGFLVWRMMFPVPSVPVLDTWRSGSVEGGGTFRYPPETNGAYVSMQDWPPAVGAQVGVFSCNEEHPSSPGAQTSQLTIESDLYCVTVLREGAAGSTYATYTYATTRGERIVTVSFTVRMPQCVNYDDPARGDCIAAQAAFDADALVVEIVRTIAW